MTWTHDLHTRSVKAIADASQSAFGNNWKSRLVEDAGIGLTFVAIKRWESLQSYAACMLPKVIDIGSFLERHAQAHLNLINKFSKLPVSTENDLKLVREAGRLMYGKRWKSAMSNMLKAACDIDASPSLFSKMDNEKHVSDRLPVIAKAITSQLKSRADEIDAICDEYHIIARWLFEQHAASGEYDHPLDRIEAINGFPFLVASDDNAILDHPLT